MGYSGKYKVINKKKYLGDFNKITWRSLWERKVCRYLDLTSNVISWSSEEVIIPYTSPIDGKRHRYFVDFYCEVLSKSGNVVKYLLEIKPNSQRFAPKKRKRISKRYLQEIQTYGVNMAKWEAAELWCSKRGVKFKVVDEYDMGIKKRKK